MLGSACCATPDCDRVYNTLKTMITLAEGDAVVACKCRASQQASLVVRVSELETLVATQSLH